MKNTIILLLALLTVPAFAKGKFQNEDLKSEAELIAAGSTKAHLPNDDKVYVKAKSINKTLNQAIVDGDLSGPSSLPYSITAMSCGGYTLALTNGDSNGNAPLLSCTSSSSQSVTVPNNSSVAFPIGEKINLVQSGTGPIVLTAAGGVTFGTADGISTTAQYSLATLIKTGTNFWQIFGTHLANLIVATGGTITTSGNFKIHTFTSSGTFTVVSGAGNLDSLVIAGGGSGGTSSGGAGGGGAGGLIYTTAEAASITAYPVTVGAGGATPFPTLTFGNNGANSDFNGHTATGGGGGGSYSSNNAQNGGSGGGGANNFATGFPGGLGTVGQGNDGGAGSSGSTSAMGGGGGAGAVGGAGSGSTAGDGGVGVSNSITGTPIFYAGGGGGGTETPFSTIAGAGGNGGGGAGSVDSTAATDGTDGKGGGGGGGGSNAGAGPSGKGGDGVVIIRYQYQ